MHHKFIMFTRFGANILIGDIFHSTNMMLLNIFECFHSDSTPRLAVWWSINEPLLNEVAGS